METIKFIVKYRGDGLNEELHVVCPRDISSIFSLLRSICYRIMGISKGVANGTTEYGSFYVQANGVFHIELFGIDMFGANGSFEFSGKLSEI